MEQTKKTLTRIQLQESCANRTNLILVFAQHEAHFRNRSFDIAGTYARAHDTHGFIYQDNSPPLGKRPFTSCSMFVICKHHIIDSKVLRRHLLLPSTLHCLQIYAFPANPELGKIFDLFSLLTWINVIWAEVSRGMVWRWFYQPQIIWTKGLFFVSI